jgi:hypothetical protein
MPAGKPGEWQSYDIIFRAPRFSNAGAVSMPGYFTVLHNGVLVQESRRAQRTNGERWRAIVRAAQSQGPLMLQDHGNPVSYRNIWIREL